MSDTTQTPQVPTLESFLRNDVSPRFQELLRAAEQKLAAARKELEDLQSAKGTIAWEVEGASPSLWYVNIADGAMTVAATPLEAPFMTVAQSAADWVRFTGGMAGLFGADNRRPFGKSRIERVRSLKGSVRFVLTRLPDGSSWSCTLHFGPPPRPAEPQTTVSLAADVVKQVQSGQLNPQMAFMQGQLKLTGDPGLAMQLGMALFV
jgi:SCP-2 sterol transfer family protein